MNDIKKRKQIITHISIKGLLGIALLSGGFLAGRGELPNQTQDITPRVKTTYALPRQAGSDANKIAVVNNDQGTQVNEEHMNYATQLTGHMDQAFVFENLETARQGIHNGAYAAYIVIPSSFSESVISLNNTPNPAKLEYALNPDLEKDRTVDTLDSINQFERELNTNMSFMYVSSILEQFHQVQDDAHTIMDNDLKDTRALLEVQPEDLVQMVPIPQLTRVDNLVEAVDLSEYHQKNVEGLEDINQEYAASMDRSQVDVDKLQEEGTNLVGQFGTMEQKLDDLEVTTQDTEQSIYDQGVSDIQNILNTYNTDILGKKEQQLRTYLEGMQTTLSTRKDGLEQAIQQYNDQIDQGAFAQRLHNSLVNQADIPVVYDGAGNQLLVGGQGVALTNSNASQENLDALRQYIVGIDQIIAQGTPEIQQQYATLQSDPNIGSMLSEANAGNPFESNTDPGQLATDLNTALRVETSRRIPALDVLTQSVETAIPDFEDQITITAEDGSTQTTTVRTLLSQDIASLSDPDEVNGIVGIQPVKVSDVTQQVEGSIITPLATHAQGIKTELKQTYKNEKVALTTYNDVLTSYNPLGYIDQSTIQSHLSACPRTTRRCNPSCRTMILLTGST